MKTGRRLFLSGFVMTVVGSEALLFARDQRQPPPTRFPRMPDPGGPNRADDDPSFPPKPDPKEQLKENQKNLRRDTDHLLQLVKDLKEEVDKTEQTDVLSLSLVKKTEEIEKLARQIKDLIRAA